MRARIRCSARSRRRRVAARTVARPYFAAISWMRRSATLHVPQVDMKSPRRSRGTRMLANMRSSTPRTSSPRLATLRMGMRMPSWKISVDFPEMLPGVVPPTSPQCARTTGKRVRVSSTKTGKIIAMSLRWVPPV